MCVSISVGLLFVAQKASWNPSGVEPVDWNQVDIKEYGKTHTRGHSEFSNVVQSDVHKSFS